MVGTSVKLKGFVIDMRINSKSPFFISKTKSKGNDKGESICH